MARWIMRIATAEGHNPLCGDHLNIKINLSRGCINDISFQGESCAICKASASMMTAKVKGKTQEDAETLIQEFREMTIGKLELNSNHHLGHLTVFSGVRETTYSCQMCNLAMAYATCSAKLCRYSFDRRLMMILCMSLSVTHDRKIRMPRISEIEGTPNPNALKFVLKEPLTWGITHSYENAEQAKNDPLAAELFEIDHVTNVFYVDRWITITQDGDANWSDLAREVADPIRAAPAADTQSAATIATANTIISDLSPKDQLRLEKNQQLTRRRNSALSAG